MSVKTCRTYSAQSSGQTQSDGGRKKRRQRSDSAKTALTGSQPKRNRMLRHRSKEGGNQNACLRHCRCYNPRMEKHRAAFLPIFAIVARLQPIAACIALQLRAAPAKPVVGQKRSAGVLGFIVDGYCPL